MSDLGYFAAFGLILVLMIGISAWMAWYSRRAMKSHKSQIEDMVQEMRDLMEEDDDAASPPPKE